MINDIPEKYLNELVHYMNFDVPRYGYTAAILMKQDEDKYKIYKRSSEPCYGFLRKYKSTHGEKATQDEHKPGDLRNPFPDGEPIALALPFHPLTMANAKNLINYLWSNESPWIKGFGGVEHLIPTHDLTERFLASTPETRNGFILTNTDVDPTVMVNLAKITNNYSQIMEARFNELRNEGMTDFEALVCTGWNGVGVADFSGQGTVYTSYMMTKLPSIKKLKTGEVNDVSKGTWRKGFDYSRRNIQDLFKRDENEPDFNEMMAASSKDNKSIKDYVKVAKETIKKCLG